MAMLQGNPEVVEKTDYPFLLIVGLHENRFAMIPFHSEEEARAEAKLRVSNGIPSGQAYLVPLKSMFRQKDVPWSPVG